MTEWASAEPAPPEHEPEPAAARLTDVTPITTRRLVLRQWPDADRAPFAALNADPEVMRYFPSTLTAAESDAAVDRFAARIAETGWGLWAVDHDGTFLGFTGLAIPAFSAPFTPTVEVGWRFTRAAWGHGFATEAARAALAVGFDRLALPEIVSFTSVGNERSRAVMRRLGMTHDSRDDFDHPNLAPVHPLRQHVLYRCEPQKCLGEDGGTEINLRRERTQVGEDVTGVHRPTPAVTPRAWRVPRRQ